jgi:hypothetical protein
MIEDAQRILDYLPISFRNQSEQEYISFLWDAFVTNYEAKKYPFAFLTYHMLFMSFVYFEIWQIKINNSEDFEKAMIGFTKDMENKLMEASSPFLLWRVNERSVFRFLKLIGMNNSDIGQFSKIVDERNKAAHSNGVIYSRSQQDVDNRIDEILRCIEKIQNHSVRNIKVCYENFLLASADLDNREFTDDDDQIREILVYGNYFSPKDISVLKEFDITKFNTHEHYDDIRTLATTLNTMYPDE